MVDELPSLGWRIILLIDLDVSAFFISSALDVESLPVFDVFESTFLLIPDELLPPTTVSVPGLHSGLSSSTSDVP